MYMMPSKTKNSKIPQKESSATLPTLTPFHWKKRQEGLKAVEEMSKNPYSLEEARAQVLRIKKSREQSKNKS